ncbi:MAG: hypothetical protein ABFC94_01055, partial [Syntrophomonas sp.]
DFTCSPGRDYRDTEIVVKQHNKIHIIHTQLYLNSKELREIFEAICKEKGIKYTVRDRGLY